MSIMREESIGASSSGKRELVAGFVLFFTLGFFFVVTTVIMFDNTLGSSFVVFMAAGMLAVGLFCFRRLWRTSKEKTTAITAAAVVLVVLVGLSVFVLVPYSRFEQDHKRRMQKEAAEHAAILQIVDDVKGLVPDCRLARHKEVRLSGSPIVWVASNNATLDASKGAFLNAKAITVFMVVDVSYPLIGRYTASSFQGQERLPDIEKPAYGIDMGVAVAYWPERKPAGFGVIHDETPRPDKDIPYSEQKLLEWIKSTPRAEP